MLHSVPLNLQLDDIKANLCMLLLDINLSFFLTEYLEVVEAQKSSYYEIPNPRVGGFVGQDDIVQKIHEALSDGSGPHVAVLQGMGG